MIWNKDLKQYKAPRNALTAFGYVLRNVILILALIFIATMDLEQIL